MIRLFVCFFFSRKGDGAHTRNVSGRVDRLQVARRARSHQSDIGGRGSGEGGRFAQSSQQTQQTLLHVRHSVGR